MLIGEGPETVLSVMELTGLPGIATCGKGGMPPLEPPPAEEYILLVDCDDDGGSRRDAGTLAQRLVGAVVRIAVPNRPKGSKSGWDWNDALMAADGQEKKLAKLKQTILQAPTFDAVMTGEERREIRINALAALKFDDHLSYEQARTGASKDLQMRLSVLDAEVERRCQGLRERKSEPPKPNIELLAASARDIIESEDVLGMLAQHVEQVIAGEKNLAKLLYLVGTTRLFDKAMHAAIKGPSAGGKSETRKRLLRYFPLEEVIEFTALSEKALLYHKDDFQRKILSMGEAHGQDETKFQDYLLRELMSENVINYMVPIKRGNSIETITVTKHGPVAFVVTTTRNALNPENETRMLSLEIDDSERQTKKVLQKVAVVEGYNRAPPETAFTPWHNYQRWLAADECRVTIPFAKTLGKMMGSTKSVRLRRDFGQLLRAVKAHALLHRAHRDRDDAGVIKATINQDYAAVRKLMRDLLATASELKTRKAITETIAAVKKLEPGRRGGVKVRQVADALKFSIGRRRNAGYARRAMMVIWSTWRNGRVVRRDMRSAGRCPARRIPYCPNRRPYMRRSRGRSAARQRSGNEERVRRIHRESGCTACTGDTNH